MCLLLRVCLIHDDKDSKALESRPAMPSLEEICVPIKNVNRARISKLFQEVFGALRTGLFGSLMSHEMHFFMNFGPCYQAFDM